MKKILLIIGFLVLAGLVVLWVAIFRTNVSGSTTEIPLRFFGVNLIGAVDWSGNHTSPVTWDINYTDITKISTALFDPALMSKIGSTQDDFMSYGLAHKDNQVFVVLSQKNGDDWYTPDLVTEDKSKLSGKIFIKGRLDGGSEPTSFYDKTLAMDIVYDGIQNSQELLPFTDLYSMYLVSPDQDKNNKITAKVIVDKNGNIALKDILVNDKICISKLKVDFSDTGCWRDFRAQNQSHKKYSLVFLPLLYRELMGK